MSHQCDDVAVVEVNVLVASLDQAGSVAGALAGLCDETDRAGVSRLRGEQRRLDRLAGRGLLRLGLGLVLDVPPRAVAVDRRPGMPPRLAAQDGPAAGVGMSLSHSGRLVAVAVARGADLGIDVEQVDPTLDVDAVARRTFTAREQRALCEVRGCERTARFYETWTRKEAYLKALGVGWALTPDRHPDLDLPRTVDGCRVSDVPVTPGYAAAVATIPHAPAGDHATGRRSTIHLTTIGVP
jgi:4'-phosphopantetheinyl transferase